MRLSDAIMAGSKLRPQAFGTYFDGTGSCAMEAASEAAGFNGSTSLLIKWPILGLMVNCPKCDKWCSLWDIIINLNDHHKASREWIACWVREIEARVDAGVR